MNFCFLLYFFIQTKTFNLKTSDIEMQDSNHSDVSLTLVSQSRPVHEKAKKYMDERINRTWRRDCYEAKEYVREILEKPDFIDALKINAVTCTV